MNASTLPSTLRTPHETFLALAPDAQSRASAYRDIVAQGMPGDVIAEIRPVTAGSYALGSPRFQAKVGPMLGRRVVPGIPGRPRRAP
jgi:putative transposase